MVSLNVCSQGSTSLLPGAGIQPFPITIAIHTVKSSVDSGTYASAIASQFAEDRNFGSHHGCSTLINHFRVDRA